MGKTSPRTFEFAGEIGMKNKQVTILIPNYKTFTLTKKCLDLIKKHTDLSLAKVIVIDNQSQDESIKYLRTINWIELIERKPGLGESTISNHSRALDAALKRVDTPYVLSIHTDTFVRRSDWLNFLIDQIEQDRTIAGVGSWKLEFKPWHRRFFKWIEEKYQRMIQKIFKNKKYNISGINDKFYYLRSHCALYRTDLIRQSNTCFSDGDDTAGKYMHQKLTRAGYQMIFLPSEILGKYVTHINHATMVLNPTLGIRKKTLKKGLKRLSQITTIQE